MPILTNSQKNLPGEHGSRPVFNLIPKDLAEVLTDAQIEGVLIGAVAEHRSSHRLWGEEEEEEEE